VRPHRTTQPYHGQRSTFGTGKVTAPSEELLVHSDRLLFRREAPAMKQTSRCTQGTVIANAKPWPALGLQHSACARRAGATCAWTWWVWPCGCCGQPFRRSAVRRQEDSTGCCDASCIQSHPSGGRNAVSPTASACSEILPVRLGDMP